LTVFTSLACSLAEPPATKGCQLGGDHRPHATHSHLPPGLPTTPRGSPTYAPTRQYHSRTLIRPSLGSALSPLLFVMVMEALSREFRVAFLWELLYADDLVVIAETEEDLIKRLMSGRISWRTEA